MTLASTDTLALCRDGGWLHVMLNRPDKRNAMSLAMVNDLLHVFETIQDDRSVRAVILRGAEGHFCSGGDIADMQQAAADSTGEHDAIAALNRRFGALLTQVDGAGAAVVAVCEGAVMGGGFGLACVADITLAVEGARFRLPETSLGITPAQIAPFIVQRLGLSQARRLAVTGATLDVAEALRLGLAHVHVAADGADEAVSTVLGQIRRCEPGAVAATKSIMRTVGSAPLEEILDSAAVDFAQRARSDAAQTGMLARLTRTPAPWAMS